MRPDLEPRGPRQTRICQCVSTVSPFAPSAARSYLSSCLAEETPSNGDDERFAGPLGCNGKRLTNESGRDVGSTSRGDVLSARDNDTAVGEYDRGIAEAGTEICASAACFLTGDGCTEGGVVDGGGGGSGLSSYSEARGDCA